jgi:hypothetical protein
MTRTPRKPEPTGLEILASMTLEDVEQRLAVLDAESQALRTIWRALRAKQRAKERRQRAQAATEPV